MNFKDLKKTSSANIDQLITEMDKLSGGGKSYIDDRYWTLPLDEKTGNATALVRFLPVAKDNNIPWVSLFSHGFQGPGGWYIENSLTTLGQPDPVSETNSELWNTGIDANKDIVRKRKRKQHFITNILVVSDPRNPKNEGKVFLYKFGKKIFQKIQDALKPEFETDKPVDVFDLWKGANFRLKVRKVEGYPNYDNSFFEAASPICEGDEAKMEVVWNSEYDLKEIVSPKNFKTYDELKTRMNRVLGNTAKSGPTAEAKQTIRESAPKVKTESAPWAAPEASGDDEDDALAYFKGLADD
jgi:hypothetical protein